MYGISFCLVFIDFTVAVFLLISEDPRMTANRIPFYPRT